VSDRQAWFVLGYQFPHLADAGHPVAVKIYVNSFICSVLSGLEAGVIIPWKWAEAGVVID
jgi:hypothetical protein